VSLDAMKAADIRRRVRARRRWAAVLAGGFGYMAQLAAWDDVWPTWRTDLALVHNVGRQRLTDVERARLEALSQALRADGRYLVGPWFRLSMQALHRRTGWGPYPFR
jgi:hypothetical protein